MSKKQKQKQEAKAQSQSQSDQEYGGIFDIDPDDFDMDDNQGDAMSSGDPDFYRPSLNHPEAGEEYKARIRLLPNPHQAGEHYIKKFIYYLPDPDNPDRNFYVDQPKGRESRTNIVSQAFFELRDHEHVTFQDLARTFSRRPYWWSLVHIMKDGQQPDMEGEIKIWRYSKQIKQLIDTEKEDDPSLGKEGVVVYDPIRGKDLLLHIHRKQIDKGTITSYENSEFMESAPIAAPGVDRKAEVTDEMRKKIFNFLKENAPDLQKAAPEPWDEETEQRVIESVRFTIDDEGLFRKIYKKSAQGRKKRASVKKKSDKSEKSDESKSSKSKEKSEKSDKSETKESEEKEEKSKDKPFPDNLDDVDEKKEEKKESKNKEDVDEFALGEDDDIDI